MRTTIAGRIALTALALGFVLSACSSDSSTTMPPDGGNDAEGSVVAIGAGDLFFTQGGANSTDTDLTFTAQAGNVTISLNNAGAAQHDVTVEEAGDVKVADAAPGSADEGTIELAAGTYTLYCNIPGHRAAGMEATLVVS